MVRPRREREPIFRMFALNWNRTKVKREAKISERTYFILLKEYEALSEADRKRVEREATKEEKAKALFTDYEFVQKWITRMQSERIKGWRWNVTKCERVWLLLDRKDPEHWTIDDIKLRAIPKLRQGRKSIFDIICAIRSLRPDFKEDLKTKKEKSPINIEWRHAYKQIVQQNLTIPFFESARLPFENPNLKLEGETIVRVHVTLGCREGSKAEGGLLNLDWKNVDWINKTIDVYETKTGGGFYWLGCPLDLFGDKTFEMLKEWHKICGEPNNGKIFPNLRYLPLSKKNYDLTLDSGIEESTKLPYIILCGLYHFIGKTLNLPIELKPHFARKLHASLLRKSGVTLEIVAGEPPHGIVGVGWEDLTTLKKFYVSFADEDIAKAKEKARQLAI